MFRAFSIAVLLAGVALVTGQIVRVPLAVDWCQTRGDGFYQDPYNCERFVRCVEGLKYEFDCSEGTRWDDPLKTCNFAGATGCNTTNYIQPATTPTPPVCPQGVASANQRDGSNCGRYFQCQNGVATLRYCNQGLYFNPAWRTCTPFNVLSQAEKDYCNALTTPTPQPPTTPTPPVCPQGVASANQRDASNCRRYYQCQNGVATLRYCIQGLYFNPAWRTCTPFNVLSQAEKDYCDGLTTPTPQPPTTPTPPVCPQGVANANQRDASNCGRYFECQNGVATLRSCAQGFYFSPAWRSCTPFNVLSQAEQDYCNGLTTPTPQPTMTPTPPFCPPEIVDANQRDATNCGRYYQCKSGVATLRACDQDLYYNTLWATCTPYNSLTQADKDFCESLATTTQPPVCPASLDDGLQRDPNDCNRYYRCVRGTAYPLNCPAGQYFNTISVSQPCGRFEDMTPTDQGYCAALEAERSTDPDVVCVPNVPVGFMRDAKNCSQYYWCVNGVPYLRKCDSGLYYSTFLQACSVFDDMTPTDKGYCSALTTPAPAPPVVCPSTIFAYVQHPTDCSKFYQCQAGVPQEVNCVGGTFYNPITFRCDPPQQLAKERFDQCMGGTTTAAPATVVCRGNNQGLLMDFYDQNCRRYFDCRLGQVTTVNDALQCNVGSYFNVIIKQCSTFENLPPRFQDYCLRA